MPKDAIGIGGNIYKENELSKLIISHLSKGNKSVISNIINYHMEEVRNVSRRLISLLGGSVIGARTLNACFYEAVSSLGYTTSLLCAPYQIAEPTTGFGLK